MPAGSFQSLGTPCLHGNYCQGHNTYGVCKSYVVQDRKDFLTYSGRLTSPDGQLLIRLPHVLCRPTLVLELGTCTACQGKLRI